MKADPNSKFPKLTDENYLVVAAALEAGNFSEEDIVRAEVDYARGNFFSRVFQALTD